ncbi:hypothetical protein EDD16DRAFT_1645111, partial [Pisolithus croceorrhizus]
PIPVVTLLFQLSSGGGYLMDRTTHGSCKVIKIDGETLTCWVSVPWGLGPSFSTLRITGYGRLYLEKDNRFLLTMTTVTGGSSQDVVGSYALV